MGLPQPPFHVGPYSPFASAVNEQRMSVGDMHSYSLSCEGLCPGRPWYPKPQLAVGGAAPKHKPKPITLPIPSLHDILRVVLMIKASARALAPCDKMIRIQDEHTHGNNCYNEGSARGSLDFAGGDPFAMASAMARSPIATRWLIGWGGMPAHYPLWCCGKGQPPPQTSRVAASTGPSYPPQWEDSGLPALGSRDGKNRAWGGGDDEMTK